MRRVAWIAVLAPAVLAVACAPLESEATEDASAVEIALPEGAGGGGEGWLAAPVAAPRVTSHVSHARGGGWARYDCATLSRARHRGTDFGVPLGTPVTAAAAGTVIRSVTGCPARGSMSSSCGGAFGNHVIVRHAAGTATLYAHLSPGGGQVRRGATVECGGLIGLSGNSGRSSGPHLHFEVRSGVSDEASYFRATTLDPWGGGCSSQSEPLWIGGQPSASCSAMPTEREDAVVVRATHPSEARGTPGAAVTQTFTLRNTGTTTWTAMTHALVHVGGAFSGVAQVSLPSGARVAPGASIELRVDVTTPSATGLHRGAWRMARLGGALFGREAVLAVRVPDAPRSCRSATLGREVESGECVQVDYAGCGVARCAWYGCSDGAWYCSESCSGERHPNAACAAPDPMRCEGGGAPLGTSCSDASECCEGLECDAGSDGAATCCAASGARCGASDECCGDLECTMGFCACVPEGELCTSDGACCDGLACLAGSCRPAAGCGLEQASCSVTEDCCGGLGCQASRGGGAAQCCVMSGDPCEREGDCCGDMTCEAGHCAARARGESCANLLDCEGALLCIDGVCGF